MAEVGPSEKQRAAYDLRAQGKTWEEIGTILGITPQTSRDRVKAAERHGLPPLMAERLWKRAPAPNAGEPTRVKRLSDGEGMFAPGGVFDRSAFLELAASAGIPPRIGGALARRVEMNFGPVRSEIKKLTAAEQVTATIAAAQLVLAHIDEVSIAGMNAKDLAIAYGVLVDKAQLLGGKPTQVYDFNLRAKLEVIMPQFLAEAKRRGITVDGEATLVRDDDGQSA